MREEENIGRQAEKILPPPPTSPAYKRALPVSLRRHDHHYELRIELEHAVFPTPPLFPSHFQHRHILPKTGCRRRRCGVRASVHPLKRNSGQIGKQRRVNTRKARTQTTLNRKESTTKASTSFPLPPPPYFIISTTNPSTLIFPSND